MKRIFALLIGLSIMLMGLTSCNGGGSNIEIPEETEVGDVSYEIKETVDSSFSDVFYMISFIDKTETPYTLASELQYGNGAEVIGKAEAVTKEEIDMALSENSVLKSDELIKACADEIDRVLSVSSPTADVMNMFLLHDEGKEEMQAYYGDFIPFYKEHNLKTSCDIKFEKLFYEPFGLGWDTTFFATKFTVDITTEEGEGDLSAVSYLPPVGETNTVDVYIVGEYSDNVLTLEIVQIGDAIFGEEYRF